MSLIINDRKLYRVRYPMSGKAFKVKRFYKKIRPKVWQKSNRPMKVELAINWHLYADNNALGIGVK